MASNKTRTRKRKRNKKTYKKIYRKTYRKIRSSRRMRVGGGNMFPIFNQLASNLGSGVTSSFSMFGSKAQAEVKNNINNITEKSKAELDKAKAEFKKAGEVVVKKADCLKS